MTQFQEQPRTRGSGRPHPLTRRVVAVLGCCLAGVTAVTACGGGDGSGTAGSTTSTSSTPTTIVTSSEPAIDTLLEAGTPPTEPEPAFTAVVVCFTAVALVLAGDPSSSDVATSLDLAHRDV
ncbi:hypothetical protein ACGF5T_17630 [Streptomyces sp. NPDC047853]|uniref:hypothetical protein n=1 Tax=unclassified Streptomyces TaxID=2593676 RepID=UPI0034553D24